jgi:hypothetical protein
MVADPVEVAPVQYTFDSEKVCPQLAQVMASAADGFVDIRKKQSSANRTVNVWNTSLQAENAECRILDMGSGIPVYLCSVALPGAQSAVNWHAAVQETLMGCLSSVGGRWSTSESDDRSGKVTLLQSADAAAPLVTIRYYRNDKMLSADNWTGVLAVGKQALAP